jgi:hypothetical protein
MPAVPRIPSRLIEPLRRIAAGSCLVLALLSWIGGPSRTASASDAVRPPAGRTATSVPVFADVATLVRVGDVVDLVVPNRPAGDTAPAVNDRVVASAVRVLAVHAASGGIGGTDRTAYLVVATTRADAVSIAADVTFGPFTAVVGSP